MKNVTAYLIAPQKLELRDSAMPQLGPDDVLLEMLYNGICGSDVSIFRDPNLGGAWNTQLPIVLGHECSGRVVGKGSNVADLKEGDVVAVEPGVPCGKCEYCMSGRYNLCPHMIFMAAPPFATGSLSKYVVHPANLCFKLKAGMAAMDGALIEPLAVGMYAARRAGAGIYTNVCILGAGCIGMMTMLACKASGVKDVFVLDRFANRLDMAMQLGASGVINTAECDPVERLMQLTGNKGAELVFETAGNPVTAALTIRLVKPGGRIVMVGNIHGQVDFDFFAANNKETDVLSIYRYKNIFPAAIEMISGGSLAPAALVSRVFPFEKCQEAFAYAYGEKQVALKVMIEM